MSKRIAAASGFLQLGMQLGYAEIIGAPFVMRPAKRSVSAAVALCNCGAFFIATERAVRLGGQNSCGCLNRDRLHGIWTAMKARCTNPHADSYPKYGGLGISVCKEWSDSFLAFRSWSIANGYADKLSIDRKINSLGYSPDNCRWVSRIVQCNNKTNNKLIEAFGEQKTAAEWARDARCLVTERTLHKRVFVKCNPAEQSIVTPSRQSGPKTVCRSATRKSLQ